MKWLLKKRQAVLREWRADRLSYIDTVRALVDTGINAEQAHDLVARS